MKTILKFVFISSTAALLSSTSALAQSIMVKADKIITNTNAGILESAELYIINGKVSMTAPIGPNQTEIKKKQTLKRQYPSGDKQMMTIQGDNYWVTPGFFAPFSNMGLVEVGAESSTNDISAGDASVSASLRAADSFNPKATHIPVSRLGGVTYAAIVPGTGKDIFGGIGAIASTDGSFNSLIDENAFVYIQLGWRGARKMGGSRSAALGYLRAALADAANYNSRYKAPKDGDALPRIDANSLRKAVRGQMPMLIGADRAVDMHNIAKLKNKYPKLNIIIVGAAEGWMAADILKKANIAVMVDPIENLPYSFDQIATRADNTKRLIDAGVRTAIMTRNVTGGTAHNLRLQGQHAGNAVANGVSWESAFKAITMTPASFYGRPELGRIKTGDKANLVIWDGDPLEVTSAPVAIIIDGKLQDMKSRQTELTKRYNPTVKDKPDYGYRR